MIEWSFDQQINLCENQWVEIQSGNGLEKVLSANDSPNMVVLEVGEGIHFEIGNLEAPMSISISNYAMTMYHIVLATKLWVKGLEVSFLSIVSTIGNYKF